MTDVTVDQTTLVVEIPSVEVIAVEDIGIEVIAVAEQGPPGPTEDPLALHTSMRLAEFNTQQAKAEARASLELEYIDGGTFN